jgi:uncharacterized protein YjeT (DUF2065 family)
MTVAVGLIVAYMLHRRFKRFLLAPPVLPEAEASDDARLVFAFRLFTAGLFVVGCAVAYFVGGSYRV